MPARLNLSDSVISLWRALPRRSVAMLLLVYHRLLDSWLACFRRGTGSELVMSNALGFNQSTLLVHSAATSGSMGERT
jgi:hypothetical protein